MASLFKCVLIILRGQSRHGKWIFGTQGRLEPYLLTKWIAAYSIQGPRSLREESERIFPNLSLFQLWIIEWMRKDSNLSFSMVAKSDTLEIKCGEKSLCRHQQGPSQTSWWRIWKISCAENKEIPMWSSRPARGTDTLLTPLRFSREEVIRIAAEDLMGSSGPAPITIERRLMKNYGACYRIPYEGCPREDRWRVDPEGKVWCDKVVKWIAYKVRSASYLLLIKGWPPHWQFIRASETKTWI